MNNLFDVGYYDEHALRAMGFGAVGENVRIAKNCVIVGDLANIRLGNQVRMDVFGTLIATGPITIGSYVHIAAYAHLSAGDGIVLGFLRPVARGEAL